MDSRCRLLAAMIVIGSFVSSAQLHVQAQPSNTTDPLPSWNQGKAKSAILDFVKRTTTEGSPDFVAIPNRIAVFDNDGTLWPENPMPFEVAFALDAAKAEMAKNPQLKDSPAYKALAGGDVSALRVCVKITWTIAVG